MALKIGTAGWGIPREVADRFPAEGTSLQRYSARFPVAEINSSFHRSHRRSIWERWADSVPADFRFSVKIPKTITHVQKLQDCDQLISAFIEEVQPLGSKLAVLLVQLPPKLPFDPAAARDFFSDLRTRSSALIACEPRHPSWFTADADSTLAAFEVARVAADPACCEDADCPGGWDGFSYWRLHGSPIRYRSSYAERIPAYAERLTAPAAGGDRWCIFDNTASSAAAADALALVAATGRR